MSFEVISERLTALQESNAQLKELIERLGNIKFQPGSIPLDDDEDNVMTELTTEIQQTVRELEEDWEGLEEDVLELGLKGEEGERRRVLEGAVGRGVKVLKSSEIDFRKALLVARHNLTAAQKQERELLLQSYLETPDRSSTSSPLPDHQYPHQRRQQQKRSNLTQAEKELNASSDFTLALRRTHESMASELSRSQFAHDTLKESTAALETLTEQYSVLDTMLSNSKNLLGTLMKSNKSDTWYLETAFYILAITIVWLVWRRLLYGPTWWLFWFPMKMFIKGWTGVFTAMGILGGVPDDGGRGVANSVSSVLGAGTGTSVVMQGTTTENPVEHVKATRAARGPGGGPPRVVHVGGGGRGAPIRGANVPGAVQQADGAAQESVSEQVGRIIDESKEHGDDVSVDGDVIIEQQDDARAEQANPKKRMWEEGEAGQETRDEL